MFRYEPAHAEDWLAVATAGRVLVARADGDLDRVRTLAATALQDVSVQQVLDTLTARGLGATGPFALVFWVDGAMSEQGLGVIVRGDATVTVDTEGATVTVSAGGVTTWTEQVIENATAFSVVVAPSTPSEIALPLRDGVAWVTRIDYPASAADPERASAAATVTSEPASGKAPARASATADDAVTGDTVVSVAAVESGPRPSVPHTRAAEETRIFGTTSSSATREDSAAGAPDGTLEGGHDDYDYLFDETIVQKASTHPADPPGREGAGGDATVSSHRGSTHDTLGDHDGRTVLASDIQAAKSANAGRGTNAHIPREHHYTLVLPGGAVQPLTAPVVLGRAPSVSHVPASVLPHLVTLTGDDISRSHVRIAVEGGTVVVTDLHSSNGTHVIAPGKGPQLLRAGEPTPVIAGTVVDLGSGVELRVSEA
ncbi:hypothetical protein GCM10027416_26500 [Okibacterium endophyticum]